MVNITEFETDCRGDYDPFPFWNFAPTLAQCYLLVLIGYLVSRFQLLSASDVRGVSAFVSYVGMPGIVCMTLADATLADLRWELLLSLFLGKLVVFVLVAGASVALHGNAGVAGLLAMFCVHTNDLPVGCPLMLSLYNESRPEMMTYLFLMPAMTTVIFVPFGTFMLEIHRTRRWQKIFSKEVTIFTRKDTVTQKQVSVIFKSLLKSTPAVLAIVLGIILNFTFQGKMPSAIHQPFKVISATVPGLVLCMLGFSMVRKERYLITSAVVPATILLAVKMFLTPLVMHTIINLFIDGSNSSKHLSDFAFLYGILSPATSIFLTGQEFRKALAGMSAALIMTSFLSFPSFYFVSRFTFLPKCDLDEYIPILKEVAFWAACFSIFCDIYVGISIFLKKKWNIVPYSFVLCLILTQFITSCGLLFWKLGEMYQWILYCQILLYYAGEIYGYCWIAIGAGLLISLDPYHLVLKRRFKIIALISFIICGILVSALCVLVLVNDTKKAYIFGKANTNYEDIQLITFTIIQAITLLEVAICLLLHFKGKTLESNRNENKKGFSNPIFVMDTEDVTATHYKKKRSLSVLSEENQEKEETELYCQDDRTSECSIRKQEWIYRFSSLLILLLISLTLKFVSNIYKLFHSNALEIMIPLEFLQSSLFFGQGFFILLTFGIDTRTLSVKYTKWWRKFRYGKEEFLPSSSELDDRSEEILFCNKFRCFYLNKCFQSLAKDRKWKGNLYKECFWGHQLVDWLIEAGIAKDDYESEEMGQRLVAGAVIRHVTGARHFHDAPYLYCFVRQATEGPNES